MSMVAGVGANFVSPVYGDASPSGNNAKGLQAMHDDAALLLARSQFAFTLVFHFIFPSFTIGLASYLAVLEGLWLKTRQSGFLQLFKYWIKIFALTFAMGVVS